MAPGAHAAGRKKPGHFGRGDRILLRGKTQGLVGGWKREKRKEKRGGERWPQDGGVRPLPKVGIRVERRGAYAWLGMALRKDGERGAEGEDVKGAGGDVFGGARGWDGEEEAFGGVKVDQGCGGLVIGLEADFYGFRAVVFAVEERRAAMIADVFGFGGLVGNVEDGFAFGASAAATETGDDFGDGQFVIDYGAKGKIFFLKELCKGFGLGECAGEAVEEEAAGTAEAAGAFANHFPDGGIGDEGAAAHEVEAGGHGRRGDAILAGGGDAENIAGGKMTGAKMLVKELGLGAFADAGSTEEDETPGRRGRGGSRRTLCGGALKPGGAIGLCGHGEPLVRRSLRLGRERGWPVRLELAPRVGECKGGEHKSENWN